MIKYNTIVNIISFNETGIFCEIKSYRSAQQGIIQNKQVWWQLDVKGIQAVRIEFVCLY